MPNYEEFDMLFLETITESGIDETRAKLGEFVRYMRSLPEAGEIIEEFAKMRKLDPSILHEAESFMYNDDMVVPQEFMAEDLFLHQYKGRYCYPVKAPNGDIMGMLGYDKFVTPKYLDSRAYGYKSKNSGFFGMENIEAYYRSSKPVIFVEGSICALVLRQNKFQALAFLGSYIAPYYATIMRRFGSNCIVMPDSDESGDGLAAQAKRLLPQARVLRVTSDKDIDDSRQKNPLFFQNLQQMLDCPFINLDL